jgi:UDPglucose 6-dehydrogenase
VIAVVGLGKLGSSLAAVLSHGGFDVIGVDRDPRIVAKLIAKEAPFPEPYLQEYLEESPFAVTTDIADAAGADAFFIVVPTPSQEDGTFDPRYVIEAAQEIGELIEGDKYRLVVVVSTVMPGTTGGPVKEALEKASGKLTTATLGLCYSPEFIALGRVIPDLEDPDMLLIGESSETAGRMLEGILKTSAPVKHMSLVNAELAKITVNAYVTMKISFANTLGELCEFTPGADGRVVADAVGLDSRIGGRYLQPATAYGGPCFPRDSVAFAAYGASKGVIMDLAEATTNVNDRQVWRVVDLVESYSEGPVGILGLTYKPGTPVTEASAGLRMASMLGQMGYGVAVHDPQGELSAKWLRTCATVREVLQTVRIVVLATPWPEYEEIPKLLADFPDARIIDCWSVLPPGPQIITLGRDLT